MVNFWKTFLVILLGVIVLNYEFLHVGKAQLPAPEIEETRMVANVQIHVKHVVETVRQKYQILSGTLSIDLIRCKQGQDTSPTDKIVCICSCLTNLYKSVVDLE